MNQRVLNVNQTKHLSNKTTEKKHVILRTIWQTSLVIIKAIVYNFNFFGALFIIKDMKGHQ